MTGAAPNPEAEPVVLVVDDLSANLRLMEAVLAPRGHRVILASSGAEALEVLGRDRRGNGEQGRGGGERTEQHGLPPGARAHG